VKLEIFMRISPEPLCPLRSWRELWQSETTSRTRAFPSASSSESEAWKRQKRARFHWLSFLFNRQADK
jgi:hypothetical protein